jgi:hypothetical protein
VSAWTRLESALITLLPWLMSCTAWRRGMALNGVGSGGNVGPFAKLSSMSRATSSGSAIPSSWRPLSTLRKAGVSLRSSTRVRVSDGIVAATSASTSPRRATKTTLTPRSPKSRATAAPIPSDAPATTAQGP